MSKSDEVLADALEAFKRVDEHESVNRREFISDLEFARLGEQWPAAIRRDRELDGRPCLTVNKLPAFIRQVVNDARQNKPGIVVHPADDTSDPETAEIIEGLIRNIEVTSNAEVAYDTALELAVSGGIGYLRIETAYACDDTFDQDILIKQVPNPLAIYGDPDSEAADSSDWDTAFVTASWTKERLEAEYPDAEAVDWKNGIYAGVEAPWRQDDDHVQVAEWWTRERVQKTILLLSDGSVVEAAVYKAQKALFDAIGVSVVAERQTESKKVQQRIMTGAEVLATNDWAGKYIPIVPVYGEDITVGGKRYYRSLVRDAKDAQRRYNYHLTTHTELTALAPKVPFIGPKGAFDTDQQKWATANTHNWSYIEYDGPQPPQRQSYATIPSGDVQQAMIASDDMKSIMGIHDASLGARSNETSGKAIMARQREGDVSTFNFVDNLSRAIRHAGLIIIDLIPHIYGTDRIVRIMGREGEPKKVSVGTQTGAQMQDGDGSDNESAEMAKVYDLSAGKYDLIVKAGPSFTSRREEAANQMMALIQAYPDAASIIGDLFAKNLDWPGADEIAERLKAMLPPQVQQVVNGGEKADPQVAQAQAQVRQVTQQAQGIIQQGMSQIQELQSQIKALQEDRSLEQRKLDIAAYEAETKRHEAELRARAQLLEPMTDSAPTF